MASLTRVALLSIFVVALLAYPTEIDHAQVQPIIVTKSITVSVRTLDNHQLTIEIAMAYSYERTESIILDMNWSKYYLADQIVETEVQTAFANTTEDNFFRQVVQAGQTGAGLMMSIGSKFNKSGLQLYTFLVRNVLFTPAYVAQIEAEYLATATAQAGK